MVLHSDLLYSYNSINSDLPKYSTYCTHTHTHTHTHVGFYGLRGLSIGVMVFILYKLYVLLPYTYPTPKLSPHRRLCISTFPPKNAHCMIISILNYGDTENVLINHLLLVIPMSYPCHYTNLCPHKPHKHAHTHTHTHTYTPVPLSRNAGDAWNESFQMPSEIHIDCQLLIFLKKVRHIIH